MCWCLSIIEPTLFRRMDPVTVVALSKAQIRVIHPTPLSHLRKETGPVT